MKIYFCDGCNESIPLADIQAGQVTTIKGKLFCRNCIPPGAGGSGGAAARPVASRGTHPLVVLLLLALVAWAVWREVPRLSGTRAGDEEAAAELRAGTDRRLIEALQADVAQLRGGQQEAQRNLSFQRGDVDTARAAAAELQRGIDQLREEIDGLQRGQAETGQLIEKLHLQENRAQALEARIDTLADVLASLQQSLAAGLASPPAAPAPVEEQREAPSAEDASQQAEIEAIARQLLDADAGNRFEAVDRILKGRLKPLAASLLPMLKDEDQFVRIRVMQVLGEFGHVDAVPALFEVLGDDNAMMRKTAAETLVRLTGFDPGYDAKGNKSERDKAVKKWRDWVGSHE